MRIPALKCVMVTWLLLGGILPAAAEDRAPTPETTEEALLTYLGGDGCVIGSHSAGAAMAAGLDGNALKALGARLLADGSAEQQRDWILLGSEVCTIRFPDVTSELTLNSPEVQATVQRDLWVPSLETIQHLGETSETLREFDLSLRDFEEEGISADELRKAGIDPDDLAEYVERYPCVVDASALMKELKETRGWPEERSFRAYAKLIAAGVKSGELVFFSKSPLQTPPAMMLTTPVCWSDEDMEAIAHDRTIREQYFDAFIRQISEKTSCEGGAVSDAIIGGAANKLWAELADEKPENAWIGVDVLWGAIGAGWFEGASFSNKGTPRPPLCRF